MTAAAEWLVRLQSTDTSAETRQAAERWAAASPENAHAWAQVNALWSDLGDAAQDPRVIAMRIRARADAEARRKHTPPST
ncbi:DUF4880 domain-containing protein [Phenylobacterium sp.]|uniref:FecR/PupR family sigma factor regulator n=1 Tax=Phenylobacterium sp. TaxID=1871053 RepID=UPI002731CBE2|nr:DUF4880 domain-containing protein [Phenylobacterium sp.]MDP1619233.1 DUF4880 domain-containing protein [Phenylobacterium sp.]MDP1987872.1 DUF4880 domain-containing protein [Phenylobacterium sp.]